MLNHFDVRFRTTQREPHGDLQSELSGSLTLRPRSPSSRPLPQTILRSSGRSWRRGSPQMTESRSRAREGCLVHGQISAPELENPIDCTIWDISHDGARLILPDGAALPDTIRIRT